MHGTKAQLSLAEARTGTSYTVLGVAGDDRLSQELQEAGIVVGTELLVIQSGPVITFTVRGATLALRKAEAKRILL